MIHAWKLGFLSIVLAAALAKATAQEPPRNDADSVPAGTNVPGAQYPRITSDLRVVFRIKAPDAQKVEFAFFTKPVFVEIVPGIPMPTVALRPISFSIPATASATVRTVPW